MTEIKICGLFRDCDIDYANEAEPDYIGFILNFPKSHRNLSSQQARSLRSRLRQGIKAVGVFVNQPIDFVVETACTVGLDVVQLHGQETERDIRTLQKELKLPVWKAFRVRSAADLADAKESAADEILLDSGYGTGKAFDWSLMSSFERPFILAGGLTPELIGQAVSMMHPKMLDISSGVETDRVKDREKMLRAVQKAHGETSEPEKANAFSLR
ncbi:MAG: phosphoribosylanthranilate isomerase [Blautia sp.]|nr:phosphoribosylanthranilate isomerase [Blautia sp.]